MALPIWIPDALRSEPKPLDQGYWRCVEAQHVVSTMRLVDTQDEQSLLEDILEDTKPPVPPDCKHLDYLYSTPFRYGLYPKGSRFRRAGQTPGVYYVSEHQETALVETAFHLLLFYSDSPDTPFPKQPSKHTAFNVPVKTSKSIHLASPPFNQARDLWKHPTNYEPCQSLEEVAREAGIEIITHASVREPSARTNAAILTCAAFADKKPSLFKGWSLLFNKTGLHAFSDLNDARFSLGPEAFSNDQRLYGFDWQARAV